MRGNECNTCQGQERRFQNKMPAEKNSVQYPPAIEWDEWQQINAVQHERNQRRFLQQRTADHKGRGTQHEAQDNSRHWSGEIHHRSLPTFYIVMASGYRSPEQWDKKHPDVGVMEDSHGNVMSEFMKQHEAGQQTH